jgi:hypothetical protein
MPISGRGLTQAADNCFIHTQMVGGEETARIVIGAIHRQGTGDRGNPPECLNGFGTAGTPFALGHVMALELGGPDISANIVPQYGQWQGNVLGAWRRMEVAVAADIFAAQVFIAWLDHGAGPFTETWQAQYDRFSSGGDKLFHWQEPRIPTRFRVWTLRHDWTGGGLRMADYFAAAAAAKDAGVDALLAALPDGRCVFDETIAAMPGIDRGYWRKQMLNGWLRQRHFVYERGKKSEIKVAERHREKLVEKLTEQRGSGRASGRLAVKSPVLMLSAAKLPVVLSQAQWLQDDKLMAKELEKLHDPTDPPRAVKGWSAQEMHELDMDELRRAVFQA